MIKSALDMDIPTIISLPSMSSHSEWLIFNIYLFDFHISVRINIVGIALFTLSLSLHWGFYTKTQKFGKSAGEGQLKLLPYGEERKYDTTLVRVDEKGVRAHHQPSKDKTRCSVKSGPLLLALTPRLRLTVRWRLSRRGAGRPSWAAAWRRATAAGWRSAGRRGRHPDSRRPRPAAAAAPAAAARSRDGGRGRTASSCPPPGTVPCGSAAAAPAGSPRAHDASPRALPSSSTASNLHKYKHNFD